MSMTSNVPKVSLICGSATLVWSNKAITVDRVHDESGGKDMSEPVAQVLTLPDMPVEWPAMEAEIAKCGKAVAEVLLASGNSMTFVADTVERSDSGIIVTLKIKHRPIAALGDRIKASMEGIQVDIFERVSELLERKRPARGMKRADIYEWILDNLPDSKMKD